MIENFRMSKINQAWNSFWFQLCSRRMFNNYRLLFFLGAGCFTFEFSLVEFNNDTLWSPVGVISWLGLEPSHWIFPASRYTAVFMCLLAAFGLLSPWTAILSFISMLLCYGHALGFGKVFHSYHLMVGAAGILCLAGSSSNRGSGLSHGWVIQLIKFYTVWIYFICGLSKVISGGVTWFLSDNLYLILLARPSLGPLGPYFLEVDSFFQQTTALIVVLIEVLSPLALVSRNWGYLFFALWIIFHTGVSLIMGGHLTFFSQILVATVFLPLEKIPSPGDLARFIKVVIIRQKGTLKSPL